MKEDKNFRKDKLRLGIYVLPNLFTTLNMLFGFYALISAINSRFANAALALIIAVVFDILDGKIARATHTTSRFGIEYDSLADLISFGLAPGMMMYMWALRPLGRIGWLAAFLFLVCGALRLARFNTQTGTISSHHFLGLPIPAAAGMNATIILLCHKFGWMESVNPFLILGTMNCLAFLMVSTIKYNSFKQAELFRRMNFNVLVAVILFMILIAAQPSITLFLFGVTYILSGPVNYIRHYNHIRHQKAQARET
jgi:CDP-diacylglycerol---serine O-phosphatidyltransferase